MKRLSELRRGTQTLKDPTTTGLDVGTIRNSAPYPSAIEALFEGKPVTIIATGDVVGMSPAVQIVEQDGHLDWVSAEDVEITQRGVLPQSEQTRQRTQR